jgi:hypothetical protein
MDTFEHDQVGILAVLEEPICVLRDALEQGVVLASGFFEDRERHPYDTMLDAHLIRYGACNHLKAITPDGWMPKFRHHSGVEVHQDPYCSKVAKSYKNSVGSPGKNIARIEFFKQEAAGRLFADGVGLLLDWDLDLDREVVLHLSKPTDAWKFGEKPKLEWRHRIDIVDDNLEFVPTDEDVHVEPMFDLDDLAEEDLE